MGKISGVSIFLPYKVLDNLSYVNLFGYCINSKSHIFINSVISVKTDKSSSDLLHFHQFLNEKPNFGTELQFTGIIYASKKKRKISLQFLENYYKHMWFIIRVDINNNFFHLEKYNSHHDYSTNLIFYDSFELLNSYLLFPKNLLEDQKNIVSFLVSSLEYDDQLFSFLNSSHKYEFNAFSFVFVNRDFGSFYPFAPFIERTVLFLNKTFAGFRCFQSLLKLVKLSHVGRQIHQRTLHAQKIILNHDAKKVDLKRKNLIFSIFFDVLCGWLITFFILKLDLPVLFLDSTIKYTNNIVNGLQKLIFWLMGVPAGLKLNIPLNSALGHFFLYHIYLWEAYMTIVLPVFHIVLKISTFIGIFGLTFVLSLLSDVISLATIHIYCFYGYATRLYGYQISCLSALWRLFRGKKWNPLRQRVDSHSYDVYQLYLGTLLFTVLLFLLPTVFVYYLVFMCLRVIVLTVQGLFSKFIDILSIFPFYSVALRLLHSPVTNGDIYFSVFSSEATLVLSMKFIQAPFSTVIQNTLPELDKYGKIFGWKELISKILTGDIIYPL
ncbi:phosphatidylinositol N-acetylglucosaminyltransferase subunit Q isoform X2 [Parasteatoda tepidariorum]|uniref:phosphatidylinositol N-acetylglucosaminyltransferase subunit Q isoform X2 n=1 Tax=Parasteatoda tepidariorum TaxID=114398 RepID=UPI00077FB005|nr:phosphatidylinositol N-acetylglucosaminyltransferase subunit Q isoform X2 [Parasteatoda tepidariorum]